MHAKHVPFDGGEYTLTNNKIHLSTIVAPFQYSYTVYTASIAIYSHFKKQNTATQQIKLSIRLSKINLQFIITARMEF